MFSQIVAAVLCLQYASAYICCGPKQLEGFQGTTSGVLINGVGSAIRSLNNYSMDADLGRMALRGSYDFNGQPVTMNLVYDFKNGKEYDVYNGVCTVKSIPVVDAFNCIPDDAKKLLSTYYGVGTDMFPVDIYEYTVGGSPVQLTFSRSSCVPIGGTQNIENGISSYGFMGYKTTIADPSVFDIPSECRHVSPKMNPVVGKVTVDPNQII